MTIRRYVLLVAYNSTKDILLYIAEEVLYWVQPRAILSVEEDIDLHRLACLKYFMVLVELSIVHQKYYRPLLS